MIDTLIVGQRLRFRINGELHLGDITGIDLPMSAIHVRREYGSPRRLVISPAQIHEVEDYMNDGDMVPFLLPDEEETALEQMGYKL
jgi:hypothetical protein